MGPALRGNCSIRRTADQGLNEWGDFLAGASAPLALLWLVIGYFQQGEELKLNTEALRAQHEELRRQVEETALLAKNSKRQALASEALAEMNLSEIEKTERREKLEAQPSFWPKGGSTSGPKITTNIINEGGTAFDPELHYGGELDLQLQSVGRKWEPEQVRKLCFEQKGQTPIEYPFEFAISYKDRFGEAHRKRFVYKREFNFSEIGA